jgi:membrane protease YdiL (CAAX protease family)
VVFFVTTFIVTWVSWGLAGAIGLTQALSAPLVYLGIFAPGLVALALTARQSGRDGVQALLAKLFAWQVHPKWFVFALTYMAAVKLTAALVHRVATGQWPAFGALPWYLMLAGTLGSTLILGQAGEELGWRGWALPRLALRMGLARASILLGVIWAVWHLPLFFIAGTDKTAASFPLYLLQVTALSVAIAWVYARTNGSLLLTMLLHAAINNTKDIVPSGDQGATNWWALSGSRVAWISVALLWLAAAYFLFRMREPGQPAPRDPPPG